MDQILRCLKDMMKSRVDIFFWEAVCFLSVTDENCRETSFTLSKQGSSISRCRSRLRVLRQIHQTSESYPTKQWMTSFNGNAVSRIQGQWPKAPGLSRGGVLCIQLFLLADALDLLFFVWLLAFFLHLFPQHLQQLEHQAPLSALLLKQTFYGARNVMHLFICISQINSVHIMQHCTHRNVIRPNNGAAWNRNCFQRPTMPQSIRCDTQSKEAGWLVPWPEYPVSKKYHNWSSPTQEGTKKLKLGCTFLSNRSLSKADMTDTNHLQR